MPKGVPVAHAGVPNLLCGTERRYPAEECWRIGLSTAYVFDVSVHVLFNALSVLGGTCWLLEGGMSLLRLHEKDRVSQIAAVPSILSEAVLPRAVSHVDVTGETIVEAVVDRTQRNVCLHNYFGPTEATVYATGKEVFGTEAARRLPSIGYALPGVKCSVIDAEAMARAPGTPKPARRRTARARRERRG